MHSGRNPNDALNIQRGVNAIGVPDDQTQIRFRRRNEAGVLLDNDCVLRREFRLDFKCACIEGKRIIQT